jgi:succinyl-CoA synthetase beta subunit
LIEIKFYHIRKFKGSVVSMNLHEYQAKKFLKQRGIRIPDFGIASNVDEAEEIIDEMNLTQAVIKIQVHAGGRGKAGGVKFAKTPQEIKEQVKKLLGMKMVNIQTGPSGVIANEVMITKPLDIEKEYYLAITIDREQGRPIILASPEGGVEIEELAEKSPEKICKIAFEVDGTVHGYQLLRLIKFMGWEGDVAKQGKEMVAILAKTFIELDASILEINPLVLSTQNELWALDTKLAVDENALFRHKELAACYDPTQVSPNEKAAKEFDLSYVSMEGNIGCMVNGAGLAMATMDIIKIHGGEPANFLDVGGGASREKVAAGFRIILSDPNVKAILINIFGGIMNCEVLAEGIVQAAKEQNIKIPLVVRMEGTNVEKGKEILKKSKLSLISAKDLNEAARKATESVR